MPPSHNSWHLGRPQRTNFTPLSSLSTTSSQPTLPTPSSHTTPPPSLHYPHPLSNLTKKWVSCPLNGDQHAPTPFHSIAHEALVVSHDRSRLGFGEKQNPGRFEPVVTRGYVTIAPARQAHRLLEGMDNGFEIEGSHPLGEAWDMCYGLKGEEDGREGGQGSRVVGMKGHPLYRETSSAGNL